MEIKDLNGLRNLIINGKIPYDRESKRYEFYAGGYKYRFNEENVEVSWPRNWFMHKLTDKDDLPWLNVFRAVLNAALDAAKYNEVRFVLREDDPIFLHIHMYHTTKSLEKLSERMVVIATIYPRF